MKNKIRVATGPASTSSASLPRFAIMLRHRRTARRWPVALAVLLCLAAAGFLFAPGAFAAEPPPAKPVPKPLAKPVAKKPAPKIDKATREAMNAMTPAQTDGLFLVLDLSETPSASTATNKAQVGAIPFTVPALAKDFLDLRQAQWKGWENDFPWSHESPRPTQPRDPQMPLLRVPTADYIAAHVLAVADDDAALTPAFTLRLGNVPHTGNEQAVQFDFPGCVPRRSEAAKADASSLVKVAGENLSYVRVPLTFAFAQDMNPAKPIEIEVTKEIRLARRNPDPNRYRYRPLGLPSGVRLAALTLEKSPLQMRVSSAEVAHAFVEPQRPTFQILLTNITTTAQSFALTVQAVHLGGTKIEMQRTGRIEPGQAAEISVPLAVTLRGYHDLTVTLADGGGRVLLRRETSFALLPPDTRQHRAESPFGTYYFGGAHYTERNADKTGPLYVKLGMRYGMFGNSEAGARKKYGLVKGNKPQITGAKKGVEGFEKVLADNPDLPPLALIFHETSISGNHITRIPDLFTDRTYTLTAGEETRFKDLWDSAVAVAQAMRAKHPAVKLALGNGPLPTKEEFLRRKFPAALFDSLGNESLGAGIPPEAQPPNWLANNASLWMDRQLLDSYGYADKPVSQCHEVCYPSTNPGNLDFTTQADYFVRHALHSLAWGVPAFRPGILTDVGGNYRWSHWGASGFCHAIPEMNVKPSFVAFATMTLQLDGAKFVRAVPLGSPALYGVEFVRPDRSQLLALWTLRGERPLTLTLDGNAAWKLVDDQANEKALAVAGGKLVVTLTPSPIYLTGTGRVTSATAGAPVYRDKPEGKVSPLAPLDSLQDWKMEAGRNLELEYYDPMTPRRKGEFGFEPVTDFDGEHGALRVTPKPVTSGKPTMPMYAVLAHKTGIPVPGTPTEIGLWINGNAGWGRVIFELTDASGQRWISIGAQAKADPATVLPPEVLEHFPSPGVGDWNTQDAFGVSRINFDGWRYVAFPLPGDYPGEGYGWPANSQWRWDKDGKVHHPFTLRKLVVELNEKVLHLKTYAPVPRPEIYLKDLVVAQGDTVLVKAIVPENSPVAKPGGTQASRGLGAGE